MQGSKRLLVLLMVVASPILYAEPVSILQDRPAELQPVFKTSRIPKPAKPQPAVPVFRGMASWYSESDPGINRHTANGEVFDDSKLTCASWDFPFGTLLEVKNAETGKSVICRVNDRGPARRLNRLIDLTKTAYRKIDNPRNGLVWVEVRVKK